MGKVADDSHNDVGPVLTIRTVYWNQSTLGVEIVFHKIPGRELRSRAFFGGSKHLNDLVGIDHSALTHANDFLVIRCEGFEREKLIRRSKRDKQPAADGARNAYDHLAHFSRCRIRNAGTHHDLLQS